MKNGEFLTLGIESSCDETSIAVIGNGRHVLSNMISSQINIHKKFGGVVPEIASRHHLTNINQVLEESLKEADVTLRDVDLIGVTNGPGLVGALVIGVATAKALAMAHSIPLVGVNHMHGHILANLIENPDLEPPFLSLVVSGGHTNVVLVEGYNKFTVLGSTRDDAAGEAYDKVARVLDLGYPGGPLIDKLANEGKEDAIDFKRVMLEKGSLDFSFSGLKTAVLNYVNSQRQKGIEINKADLAASFQAAAVDVLVAKTMEAMELIRGDGLRIENRTIANHDLDTVVISGGVAANSQLREKMAKACEARGYKINLPKPIFCTDNGAMIGVSAYYKYKEFGADELDLDAHASMEF